MQRFSLDRRRFAGHPRRGFPHPSGGSPSPSKSPPEGGDPTPRGAGACRPPVSPSGSPSTPRGTPAGFPRLRRLPLLPLFGNGKGWASEARRGGSPGEGLEKNQSGGADRGRQAASGGNVGKAGQPVGRGGGSRWAAPGLSTGCPCSCPRAAKRRPVAQRSPHLHRRGPNSAPSGGLFCPAGLTTSVQEV